MEAPVYAQLVFQSAQAIMTSSIMISPAYLYYYVCTHARAAAQNYYGGHAAAKSLA